MFLNNNLNEFLDKVASRDLPGGGSVAGYTAALGAALGVMTYHLTNDKKAYKALDDATKAKVEEKIEAFHELIENFKYQMEADTKSFDSVLEAMKLPKETEDDKKIRADRIKEGYAIATQVPIDTANLCIKGLEYELEIVEYMNKYAISDAAAATYLLEASGCTALLNAEINVKSLADAKVEQDISNIKTRLQELKDQILEVCYRKIGEI